MRAAWYVPEHALTRVVIALAAGTGASLLLLARLQAPVALLGGWDAAGLVLLALAWITITQCDPAETHLRASGEDPGRTAVYLLVTLTSLVSLLAATVVARHAKAFAGGEGSLVVALCLLTVTMSWALTHTSFTLRYAHLYYREDAEGVGGVDFAGGAAPSYFDFAYFAFTVGMCFQVSDCPVTSPAIRKAVLGHAVLSFAYNTVILAFVLNLVFGALG